MSRSQVESELLATSRLIEGSGCFHLTHFEQSTLIVQSSELESNPWQDPVLRRNPVLVPRGAAPALGFPVVVVLSGFTGNGTQAFNLKTFEENQPQRLNRAVHQGEAPVAVYVFVDALSVWGGSQFINSPAMGNYENYVMNELLPSIKKLLPVNPNAQAWCVTGGSSGGYGALHLASRYPEVFSVSGAIAPDSFFAASLLPEAWKVAPALEKIGGTNAVFAEIQAGRLHQMRDSHAVVNFVAMGLCYAPNGNNDFEMPVDLRTGLVNEEIWQKWQAHDPVDFLQQRQSQVCKVSAWYLDVGTRDQFHLQFGTRQVHQILSEAGARVKMNEFEGNHFDIGARKPEFWKWLLTQDGFRKQI
jgi:S-formylglutathione hydrolase FrmB